MNTNLKPISLEELSNVNGGGVTAKQTLALAGGILAGFAFGPWGCAAYAAALYASDAIDDDND